MKCIDGMTNEYLDNIEKLHEVLGVSGFLCKTCRKVSSKIGKDLKKQAEEMIDMKNRIVILELERDNLVAKVEMLESKGERVNIEIKSVGVEISKAKEVKNDMRHIVV